MLRCLLKHCNTKKYGRSEGTSSCILTVGTNMKLETSAKYQPPKNRVGMTLDSKAPEPPVIREWQCPRTPVNHRMAVPWSPQKPQNGSARAPGIHRCSAPEPPLSTDAVLQSHRYPQMQSPEAPRNQRTAGPYSRWRKENCLLIPEIKPLFSGPQITGCTNKQRDKETLSCSYVILTTLQLRTLQFK